MLYIKITCNGGDNAHGNDYAMMSDLFMFIVFSANCWGMSAGGDYCLFDFDDWEAIEQEIDELVANYPQYRLEYIKSEILTQDEVDAL